MRRRVLVVTVAVVALMTAASLAVFRGTLAPHAQAGSSAVTVSLHDQSGNDVGTVSFTQSGSKVLVQAVVHDLPPGFHGFHVHTIPLCEASTSFMSAGGHFNPTNRSHADHAGDMTNLYVGDDGTGTLTMMTDRFSVGQVLGMGGASVIVHANADNFANIPTRYAPAPDATTLENGDSGTRIACGLFQ